MITALYSDQLIAENAPMDRRLAALILARGNRIGYIASAPEPRREFFDENGSTISNMGCLSISSSISTRFPATTRSAGYFPATPFI